MWVSKSGILENYSLDYYHSVLINIIFICVILMRRYIINYIYHQQYFFRNINKIAQLLKKSRYIFLLFAFRRNCHQDLSLTQLSYSKYSRKYNIYYINLLVSKFLEYKLLPFKIIRYFIFGYEVCTCMGSFINHLDSWGGEGVSKMTIL